MGCLIWIIIIALTVAGVAACCFPMFQFIGYALLALALVLLIIRLLNNLRTLRKIFVVLVCVLLAAFLVTEGFVICAALGAQSGDADYLLVLGAGVNGDTPSVSLSDRLEAAVDYLQTHPDTVCIVSGGQGEGENISEAECMYRYLTEKGIAADRIWKEDQSTSTQENMAFSKELMAQKLGEAPTQIAILSSEYHLFRAGIMAREHGFDAVLIPAKTSWKSLQLNYFLREVPALWYYLITGGYQYAF